MCKSLQVDEVDYDTRLGAYGQLTVAFWSGVPPWAAMPLAHHCFRDLRNADDLALRHASAQVCWHQMVGFQELQAVCPSVRPCVSGWLAAVCWLL
jgi:Down-regulated in metastasis